jgi:hypothetical protein
MDVTSSPIWETFVWVIGDQVIEIGFGVVPFCLIKIYVTITDVG